MRVLNTIDPGLGDRDAVRQHCVEKFPRWVASLPKRPARMAQLLDGFDVTALTTARARVDEVAREVARRSSWQRPGVRPAWYVEGFRVADEVPSDYGLMLIHDYLSYLSSVLTEEYDLQWELTDQPEMSWDLQPRIVGTPDLTPEWGLRGLTRLGRGQDWGVFEDFAVGIDAWIVRRQPWRPLGRGRTYRPPLLTPLTGHSPNVAQPTPIALSITVLLSDEREDELPAGFEHFNAVLSISEINVAERRLTEDRVAELVRRHPDVLDTHVDTQDEVWLRLADRALRETPRVTQELAELVERDAPS